MTDDDLVRLGSALADSLDRRGHHTPAGIVRNLTRRVAELAAGDPSRGPGCPGCRAPVRQHTGRGRPRKWCHICRPPVARKSPEIRA